MLASQKDLNGEVIRLPFAKGTKRNWLIPPDVYQRLDEEFHFTFDPFPYPKPKDHDALKMDWGAVNFVNPPFRKEGDVGPVNYTKKAIEENRKGKTVVLTLPVMYYVHLLIEAGAEIRPLGRVAWLDVETKEPMKSPFPAAAFILRGIDKVS